MKTCLRRSIDFKGQGCCKTKIKTSTSMEFSLEGFVSVIVATLVVALTVTSTHLLNGLRAPEVEMKGLAVLEV